MNKAEEDKYDSYEYDDDLDLNEIELELDHYVYEYLSNKTNPVNVSFNYSRDKWCVMIRYKTDRYVQFESHSSLFPTYNINTYLAAYKPVFGIFPKYEYELIGLSEKIYALLNLRIADTLKAAKLANLKQMINK